MARGSGGTSRGGTLESRDSVPETVQTAVYSSSPLDLYPGDNEKSEWVKIKEKKFA